jgi:N6-L-threonylcarbamoyladenine synthase
MSKIILGIETSCDETSAAVLEQKNGRIQILSNIIGTSAQLQEKYGGVIPEQAAREQLKLMIPVVKEALEKAHISSKKLDAIAVTYGPGLIGSLLVGVETAKTLAKIWDKPLIPVNHLIGHFYANWIENIPIFPCLGLLVSGGHTDLVLFKDHGVFEYLGGTRDDAAGECFDKCARLIGYPYPGGPKISQLAQKGDPKAYKLPRPMADSDDFDFSFSGLKTAFANLVEENFKVSSIDLENAKAHWKHIVLENKTVSEEQKLANLCASLQQAIIDSLIKKTVAAAYTNNIEQIIVAGGVAANPELIKGIREEFRGQVLVPSPILCTDNAAMIASAAFFIDAQIDPLNLQADPNLSLRL